MLCPYCKEEIQDGAIKCKHCGSSIPNQNTDTDVPSGFDNFTYALKNYATFSGRARRSEFWMFYLFYLLIAIGLTFVDVAIGTFDEQGGIGLLTALFILGMIAPSIAITARRLHDIGFSGWWQLLYIIPFGAIALLVFVLMDSRSDGNKYGTPRK